MRYGEDGRGCHDNMSATQQVRAPISVQTGPVVVHHALFSLLKNNHVGLPREGVFDVCTATHTDLPGGHRN